MNSTPNRKATKPFLIVRADERLAPAYQQTAHADYQRIARGGEQFVLPDAIKPDERFAPASEQIARAEQQFVLPDAIKPDERSAPASEQIARAEQQFVLPDAIEPDERLAPASEQIAGVNEQLARLTDRLLRLEQAAARPPSAVPRHRPSREWPVLRGLIGLLLAACIFSAAFVSQSSYGKAAKLMIARWAPQLALTSPLWQKEPGPTAQPSASADQVAAAESPQPTLSAQTAAGEVAPTVAAPELAQMHETRARDLANLEQAIEQLKTNQEQMARDHVKAFEQLRTSQDQMAGDHATAIEQLKASQEQLARDNAKVAEQLRATASFIAKASETSRQPKTSAPPPRPIATPTR